MPENDRLPPRDAALEAWRRVRQDARQALHDTICQTLGGADLILRVLTARLEAGESLALADLARLQAALDRARDEALSLTRRFPALAYPEGLMDALEALAAATGDPLRAEWRCAKPALVKDPATSHLLFLLAQEAVDNARRHAHAARLTISLASEGGQVTLEISDDGRGFLPADERRGLAMMRWHAAQAGAELSVDSQPGRGTTIRCVVSQPLQIKT